MTPQEFDARVVRSRHPAIALLYVGQIPEQYCKAAGIPFGPAKPPEVRNAAAQKLALVDGLTVDPDSDAGGMSPWYEHFMAKQGGYLTKPKIGEKLPNGGLLTPPGVSSPPIPNWNDYTFAIKVSTDPEDYQPYPTPAPGPKYVGPPLGSGLYNVINGAEKIFVAGQEHWEDLGYGKQFLFVFIVAQAGQFYWAIQP
jgi:hypothetical protein